MKYYCLIYFRFLRGQVQKIWKRRYIVLLLGPQTKEHNINKISMKTQKRTFSFAKILSTFLCASLISFSCEKPDVKDPAPEPEPDPKPEVVEYAIKLPSSEFYTIEAPEKSLPGETICITVVPVEDVYVDEVRYNGKKAEAGAVETEFFFEMPEKDVTIRVMTSAAVKVMPNSYFTGKADKEIASKGDLVTVTFVLDDISDAMGGARVNGQECTFAGIGFGEYKYTFMMPEGPALVEGYLTVDYLLIDREWDEHCVVVMLDCINHQNTPEEFCSQVPGDLVHYLYKWDIGYEVDCRVIGTTTGTDYTSQVFWSLAADNHLYQDCWAFVMPDEPVVIKAMSREKTVYQGQPFAGLYKGYWMTAGDGRILSSSAATMNLELRESSAYIMTTTDIHDYDICGLYNMTDGVLTYNSEDIRGNYAINGSLLGDDYAFIVVEDMITPKPDNRRFYLTCKDDFSFTCATDSEYAIHYLLEADKAGEKSWFYVDIRTLSIKSAEVSFVSGASISSDSEALVSIDGVPYFKYTYAAGSNPVFVYCGNESGTYVNADGKQLILDGFGNAVYDGAEGTYTIDAGFVTFTDGVNEIRFNINMDDKTFAEIVESVDIVLDPVYSTTTAYISVNGETGRLGFVEVKFDSDYSGNEKEGYARIKILYYEYGSEKDMIAASQPYFIDGTNRTVTISNVLQGTGSGYTTERKDMVLNISEDCKTLTFADPYIFSTASPKIYCFGGEETLIVSETAE